VVQTAAQSAAALIILSGAGSMPMLKGHHHSNFRYFKLSDQRIRA
jgi:hypothetical protein